MSDQERLLEALKQLEKEGKINPKLKQLLGKDEKELLKDLYKKGLIKHSLQLMDELDPEADWDLVKKRLQKANSARKVRFTILKYAAVLVGIAIISYMFLKKQGPIVNAIDENIITLKIGEQEVKMINEGENQEILSSDGTVIGLQKGNSLVYYNQSNVDKMLYNELWVPYGKIFNIELSDGTIIHLNSGSSIRYPIRFIGDGNREVSLNGEAYFKVVKDTGHPFIVNTGKLVVEVLGTEFNVSSYEEDVEISTVLVEGSIQLTNTDAPVDKVLLSPGFKAGFDKNEHSIKTNAVDLDLHVSWINGELIFRKSSFENMMKKIERKYDVTIYNRNANLSQKKFNARFDVNIESIEDVMQSISSVTPFEYTIEDNNIIIN